MCVYREHFESVNCFGIWWLVPTLGIILVYILGCVTTLYMILGLFLGLRTTFEILGCLSQTDTSELYYCTLYTGKICKMSLCSGQHKIA